MLYDMLGLESVTNGYAMSLCVKVVHYAPPLFASSKWGKKLLTDLPDQKAFKKKIITLSSAIQSEVMHFTEVLGCT